MTSPRAGRGYGWRTAAAVTAIAVLGAAAVTGLLAGRQRPAPANATPARDCSTQAGPLRKDTQFTSTAGNIVQYSISLPADYYTACVTYPVIFVLHGKEQDNASFLDEALSLRRPMAAGVLEQAVIVTPDSFRTGRWENRETGPAEDNFLALIPHIEQTYRVRTGASNRLLAGFSMGGHGAFRFGLKYPDRFAAVWSVDGAMADSEDYLRFVQNSTSAAFNIISVGGRLNGDRVKRMVDALAAQGIEIPYVYQDLDHDFTNFVDADEQADWFAMKYLQQRLGRAG